jgi:hypothetical protein
MKGNKPLYQAEFYNTMMGGNLPTGAPKSNLTVRDYIAIQMAQGMVASCTDGTYYTPDSLAEGAYEKADALIAESQKEKGDANT